MHYAAQGACKLKHWFELKSLSSCWVHTIAHSFAHFAAAMWMPRTFYLPEYCLIQLYTVSFSHGCHAVMLKRAKVVKSTVISLLLMTTLRCEMSKHKYQIIWNKQPSSFVQICLFNEQCSSCILNIIDSSATNMLSYLPRMFMNITEWHVSNFIHYYQFSCSDERMLCDHFVKMQCRSSFLLSRRSPLCSIEIQLYVMFFLCESCISPVNRHVCYMWIRSISLSFGEHFNRKTCRWS